MFTKSDLDESDQDISYLSALKIDHSLSKPSLKSNVYHKTGSIAS